MEPVHAGTIEPGRLRFSIIGEKVMRLEQWLSYAHKGIEKSFKQRFEQLTLIDGQPLAARVSGDTAVAFPWTYCMTLEAICGNSPSPRVLYLRACCWNASVSPIIWAISEVWAAMPCVAVARKLLTILNAMLRDHSTWNPNLVEPRA